MVQVETRQGLINRDELVVEDVVHETGDARVIQTVWKRKDTGEEVRTDATVSILRGLSAANQQGV